LDLNDGLPITYKVSAKNEKNNGSLSTVGNPQAISAPGKKPVGRPKLHLTPEEELARKKKRYTPKEIK